MDLSIHSEDPPLDVLISKISVLKQVRNALILAHNYQRPEIQDIADHTGDSLELSRRAAEADESVIVFCGVRFMAETAAILCPEKTVLLPVPEAGCALADTATAAQVRQMRAQYTDAMVVAYVNTSAEVKAESDICCTSANAVEVVRAIDPGRSIIFVSDRNLGYYAGRMARRHVILWHGACPTHAALTVADLAEARKAHPEAKIMVHPECRPEVLALADRVAGTAGMLAYAAGEAPGAHFIVGTDIGLLHRLTGENPDKVFYPAGDFLVCPTMKLTTLTDVVGALERNEHVVVVAEPIRSKARAALDAMMSIH